MLYAHWRISAHPGRGRPGECHGIQTGSPMVVTLGQQYNTGEKRTVVMLLVIGKEKIFTLYNESTEIFYDVYSETVVS